VGLEKYTVQMANLNPYLPLRITTREKAILYSRKKVISRGQIAKPLAIAPLVRGSRRAKGSLVLQTDLIPTWKKEGYKKKKISGSGRSAKPRKKSVLSQKTWIEVATTKEVRMKQPLYLAIEDSRTRDRKGLTGGSYTWSDKVRNHPPYLGTGWYD